MDFFQLLKGRSDVGVRASKEGKKRGTAAGGVKGAHDRAEFRSTERLVIKRESNTDTQR